MSPVRSDGHLSRSWRERKWKTECKSERQKHRSEPGDAAVNLLVVHTRHLTVPESSLGLERLGGGPAGRGNFTAFGTDEPLDFLSKFVFDVPE